MKQIGIAMLALFSSFAVAAEQLHVKANQQHILPEREGELVLDELVLEDGAVLKVPTSVQQLQIIAKKVSIGDGVKVVAGGVAGEKGQPGASQQGRAAECEAALPGEAGSAGQPGTAGTRLTLNWALASLGSLSIDVNGGQGGAGGVGGNGQDAGDFDKCPAPAGGDGGSGGPGGTGGDGGSVRLYYSVIPGSKIEGAVRDRITMTASGGAGGDGGKPGEGGVGTEGKYINMRTLTGNRKWMAGGDHGVIGAAGAKGGSGQTGAVEILRAGSVPASASMTASSEALIARKSTVSGAGKSAPNVTELEQKVAEQAQQIEQLSTKMNQVIESMQSRIDSLERQIKQLSGRNQ